MAKERSDSVLGGMPLHQQEQLITWLIEERISPEAAVVRVWNDFGVKTSETAMYRFYRRHCSPRLLRFAMQEADAVSEGAGGLTANLDKSGAKLLSQKFFELLANPGTVNPKELIAFGQLVQNGQMLALKERELGSKEEGFRLKYEQKDKEIAQKDEALRLAREKFNAQEQRNAEAREKLHAMVQAKGGLTPDTIAQIEEALQLL